MMTKWKMLFILLLVLCVLFWRDETQGQNGNINFGPDMGGAYQQRIKAASSEKLLVLAYHVVGIPDDNRSKIGITVLSATTKKDRVISSNDVNSELIHLINPQLVYADAADAFYLLFSGRNPTTKLSEVYLATSTDGLDWKAMEKLAREQNFITLMDLIYRDGNIYALWSRSSSNEKELILVNLDIAAKKLNKKTLPTGEPVLNARLAVDKQGMVYVAYATGDKGIVLRSSRLGSPFGEETLVAKPRSYVEENYGTLNLKTDDEKLFLLYAGPQVAPNERNIDIFFTRTELNDLSQWPIPVVVNDGPADRNQHHPTFAFGGDGIIVAMWADFRNDAMSKLFDIRAAVSTDHGSRFGQSFLLSETNSDVRLLLTGGIFYLSTFLLPLDDGTFLALWTDTRNGPSDIYGQYFQIQ